ncbi:MAG: thioesterase family protein [Myxococcales bacterium]|nr:thioesterase family protein [Myxococcales bacterium]
MSSDNRPSTPFADLLDHARALTLVDGRGAFELGPEWGQGRTCFGGALTTVVLETMTRLVGELTAAGGDTTRDEGGGLRRARSLQVVFAAPVAPGLAEISAACLRHGRSATVVEARVLQEDEARMTAVASFASDRPSRTRVAGTTRPELKSPEASTISLPFVAGVTPNFTKAIELRWAVGGPPGSSLDHSEGAGWCRLREPQVDTGASLIATLVDCWPSPTLQTLDRFAAASSLTWDLQLVDVAGEVAEDAWWAFAVTTDRAEGGWVHTSGRLWAPDGRLLALSRQTVAQFA